MNVNHLIYLGLLLLLFSNIFSPLLGVSDHGSVADQVCYHEQAAFSEQSMSALGWANSDTRFLTEDHLRQFNAVDHESVYLTNKSHRPLARRAAL